MSKIDSYKYWLSQLEGASAATKELYTIYFKKFCDYAKATPDALIEMQRKAMEGNGDPRENQVVENKVRAWLASERPNKSNATRRAMLTAVRSFFTLNQHPLKLLRRDSPQGESEGSRIPEKDEVIRMADAAKWKYRAAVMFLKDSGLRISDAVRVRWEDFKDMSEGFWHFNIMTQKKQVQACAFIGPETTRLLEQFKTKTGRVFKTAKDHMGDEVNALTERAGLEGVTAHGLRKYFVTSMESARVPEQYYLHMMGKKSSVYSEKRRSELFDAYKKAYPELSIYAVPETEERIRELSKQLERRDSQIEKLEADLSKTQTTMLIMLEMQKKIVAGEKFEPAKFLDQRRREVENERQAFLEYTNTYPLPEKGSELNEYMKRFKAYYKEKREET